MPARANAIKDVIDVARRSDVIDVTIDLDAADVATPPPERVGLLTPGPKMLLMALTALPATVVGLSAPTALEMASGILAGLWFALLPAALYRRWAALSLPLVGAALLLFAVGALPFNSPAFIVDYWSAAVMLVLALPKG